MGTKRAYVEIDLDCIINNIKEASLKLNSNQKIIAVIKTDAYGHGAVRIANELEKIDVIGGYAVACIEEAMELRNSGIKKMILILGYVFSNRYEEAVKNDISLTVFSLEQASILSEIAMKLGQKAKIHIKVDTGMNRIGIKPSVDTIGLVQEISYLDNLEMEGIFTHFANADAEDKTDTIRALKDFKDFIKLLHIGGVDFKIQHYANSAFVIDMPLDGCDMVRYGISLYGIYPSNEVKHAQLRLQQALSLYAAVVHVKTIEAGECVSYGSIYKAEKETKIATISFGYGDGYPRSLSNKGYVLINGKKANICGRVCMDQFMVDVSEIEDVKVGNTAVLIGSDGDNSITLEDIDKLSGRFPYEFVCDISKRVPRYYIKDSI